MLQIFPRLLGQKFEDPTFEEEILSFIRDLGHTEEIKEDLVYQVENKNSQKNKDMCYPRFTKVIASLGLQPGKAFVLLWIHFIIDYFMSKDQSISRRHKMFWHTARDDPMFNTIRVISRHQDTQIYDAILSDVLTNQEMLDSKAYKEYYDVASGAETPKAKTKYKKKADEPVTYFKSKTAPASKGSRLKSSAKVAKTTKKKQPATMPKTKGFVLLSEIALSKAEQIKLATKRSKKYFYMSHVSGSCDGVDTQSKVPHEQQQKVNGTNKGAGDKPEVLDVPKYNSESEEESWTFSQDDEDADEETDVNDDSEETESDNDRDDFTHPNLSTYKADDKEEEEKADDDEVKEVEEEQDEEEELYEDLNINLQRSDTEMTDAQQENVQENQVMEDTHVTLTSVPPAVQQQSSSVSSDLVSKFISPSSDTAISLISGIVDNYLASKMKDAMNVQVQVSKIMPKIKKCLTESLGAEVLVRSTNQPQTSYVVAASLLKFELKKILIDKMEENKSRGRDDQDKDEDAFAGSNRGSKRRRSGKEAKSLKEPTHKESKSTIDDLEEQTHKEFNTRNDDVTPIREALNDDESQWNPSSSPTPDRKWHKTKTIDNRPPQPWIT
nr:hypothetical protein [Tanacetum cinerariifolium]